MSESAETRAAELPDPNRVGFFRRFLLQGGRFDLDRFMRLSDSDHVALGVAAETVEQERADRLARAISVLRQEAPRAEDPLTVAGRRFLRGER